MSHGNNYTVEEQITGQANTGGIQFDVFPLRDSAFVVKAKGTEVHLARHMTPAELHLKKGDSLIISRYSGNGGFSHVLGQGSSWSLARFQPDLNGTIWLKATYSSGQFPDFLESCELTLGVGNRGICGSSEGTAQSERWFARGSVGLAAGGHITQRIYADTQSPRMYDEEKGHRFHVYIITPEAWEIITGVLPPISPVSEETYKMHNIPWYQLADDHLPVLPLPASNPLSGVKSVAQLDAASKHAEIDPNKPPGCTVHSSVASTCVFSPCSHTACSACLGTAMIARMSCPVPTCNARIARVVGMKDAVTIPAAGELEDQEGEMAWAVGKLEDLAIQAVDLGEVSIIHLEEDRVPGLHAPELA
ncbi:hypothetical protein PAXINDRAFT_22224 [Paxillus involutus ATCC 200175]|uniref:RING-type domain-containing protein n=1 Tax=Paxillus involutus ATCC 200175 TaxID=664439 RepID=A0A0C9SZE1_PAXIN|nr:hypothetical protein PAXINDRAFT_22224 [Paxillus involutus ATCC 200175]